MSSRVRDWPRLPLDIIASPRLGGNYRNGSTPSKRPLIKMGNIARVAIDLSRLEYIPDSESVDPMHCLKFGDVLLNTRNTLDLVGKVSIWRDELPIAYYNSNILRIEIKPEYCGDSRYFGYVLNSFDSLRAIRALATGTTSVAAVYTRDLLKLKLPVPSKEEQRAIVAALEDADKLTAALERLIAKKQAIKQGMMQQLLTCRTRLTGFTGRWLDVQAADLGTFKGGSGFSPRYQGAAAGPIPFFKVSDMNSAGNELFLERANNYVTESQRKQMGALLMPAGAIVFAKVGAAVFLERKRILTVPSCIDNNMAAYLVDVTRVDVRYMHYLLSAFPMSSLVATGALPSLNGRQLRSIPVSLPDELAEQRAIAEVLADADAELNALTSRLAKARAIKTGMMQQLLTGRTRLPVQAAS